MSPGLAGLLGVRLALGTMHVGPDAEVETAPEPVVSSDVVDEADVPAEDLVTADVEPADAEPADVEPANGESATAVEDAEPTEPGPEPSKPVTAKGPGTSDVPADDFESVPGAAPGGYYGHGVILERAPPNGRPQIVVGSILVPLGTLAAVSSAGGVWLYNPNHCEERLARVGSMLDEGGSCTGPFTLNVIRTTTGVLMLASGATILAIGLVRRERYRKWRHEHGMRARVEPVLSPGRRHAMGGLRIRF